MTLAELLHENRDAVTRRWLEDCLASYPGDSAALFRREKDPFANPVGHSLRVGTRGILEALLNGADHEKIRECLREIIKVRAVQQFSASEAVSFVFRLKEAVRAELGERAAERRLAAELTELEGRIDRIALAAFDVFVECREQVFELRVNEVKRRIAWAVKKMNERGLDPAVGRVELE